MPDQTTNKGSRGKSRPNIPWQAIPTDGIIGGRAVGLLKAAHQCTVQAWLALLEAPVLLEPVRPASHTLGILPVAKATFLQGLASHRELFRHCKREKGKRVGIKRRPGLIITECRPS